MLLSLDEDCLVCVSKFLSVEDQIILSRVCVFLKEFFEENFWKWQCKKICLTSTFWNKSENKLYLPTFLQSAETSVEELILDKDHIVNYGNFLSKLKFQKIKSCVAEVFDELQLLKINQMFPKIKQLHLKGTFKGQHIPLFTELEILNLEPFSNNISSDQFLQIYNLPNLKKITLINRYQTSNGYFEAIQLAQHCSILEEMVLIEDIYYEGIMNQLKKIKNLRSLTVRTKGSFQNLTIILKNIEKHFGEVLDTLVIQKIYISEFKSVKWLTIKSLRCIILCDVYIGMEHLELFCCNLPNNLEEFSWKSTVYKEIKANTFFRMISNCHNLRLLDLSGSPIQKNFVEDIALSADLTNLKQSLLLRCFRTKISEKDLQDLVLPEKLQVTCLKDNFCFDMLNGEYFQVELDRTKTNEEDIEEDVGVYEEPYCRDDSDYDNYDNYDDNDYDYDNSLFR